MNITRNITRFLIIISIFFSIAMAHHAMEYIEMESYNTARMGEKVFHLHYDYMVDDYSNPRADHWEFTPGISYGINNRLMVDVHTHFAKFGTAHLTNKLTDFEPLGPSPFLEAVAISAQYRVTKSGPINIAIAGVYEQPFQRSRELLDGQRVFEGIIIFSKEFGLHSNICANLKFGKDGDETVREWALGAKTPLSQDPHGIQIGMELLGDTEGNWALLPGVYLPIGSNNIIFKTGLELGKNLESMRANVTLMIRF